jgi:hypothetical protein
MPKHYLQDSELKAAVFAFIEQLPITPAQITSIEDYLTVNFA